MTLTKHMLLLAALSLLPAVAFAEEAVTTEEVAQLCASSIGRYHVELQVAVLRIEKLQKEIDNLRKEVDRLKRVPKKDEEGKK